mmetsp:Transcript_18091/g.51924  ORF Transcript_18091/g.51924 Transcript_18091/m.51924 type:complete len:164 (+) Transcript_18091:74-565(+)
MRRLAKGVWVDSALATMVESNQVPAKLAREHSATACTDVTGFGLLGHLAEMLNASEDGLCVTLMLLEVPILPGAIECVREGVFSSLQPQNRALKHVIVNDADFCEQEKYPLLFDPQTSGGLLVSLPASRADDYIAALRKADVAHNAAVVATVARGGDGGVVLA